MKNRKPFVRAAGCLFILSLLASMALGADDKAKTAEPAQAVHDRYRPEHNWGFSKPARAKPAWRKTSSGRLDRALCFKQRRTVANDNTVTFDGVIFRIP